MKKLYNNPSIKITAYTSIESTNGVAVNLSEPIGTQFGTQYEDGKAIGADTFKLNELNN